MTHGLVVEDSEVVRKVARRILEVLGHESSGAKDTETALKKCREMMPDFVLLDADMPDGAGIDFIRALRDMPGGKIPEILCILTENSVAQITEALEAGATDFLMKPIDREQVEAKLAEMGASTTSQGAANG